MCEKFRIASNWNDILSTEYYDRDTKYSLTIERLSYSMSILYALQSLPGRRICHEQRPLEDMITLDIHVVSNNPLLDSEAWELFMHRLPKLKQLNVVFIVQGKPNRHFIDLNVIFSLLRCSDCKGKDRFITYSLHQMQYHMFFSSEEYTEPDAVVVFDSSHMSASKEDAIHSEISYRNMTYSRNTVLVLTDAKKDRLIQGVKAVNAARPVDQLVSPKINPLKGCSSIRDEMDSNSAVINDKNYFTCLRRK